MGVTFTVAHPSLDGLTAPGSFNWNVSVPVNVVDGLYQLALLQTGADTVYSPAFSLTVPPNSPTTDAPTTNVPFPATTTATETTTTTVTAIYLPTGNATAVTYIYYEEECGCHKTSTCAQSDMPTSLSSTTVTYSEPACGCTTTIEAPCAETAIPVVKAAASTAAPTATNTPMAPTVAPAATSVQAASAVKSAMPTWTGAADKLAGSSIGLLAMVAALVMA